MTPHGMLRRGGPSTWAPYEAPGSASRRAERSAEYLAASPPARRRQPSPHSSRADHTRCGKHRAIHNRPEEQPHNPNSWHGHVEKHQMSRSLQPPHVGCGRPRYPHQSPTEYPLTPPESPRPRPQQSMWPARREEVHDHQSRLLRR